MLSNLSFTVVTLKAQCIVESKVAQERGLLTLEGSLDDDAALLVLASATDTVEAEEVSQEPVPEEAPAVEEAAEEPPATSELPAEEAAPAAPEEAVAPSEEIAPPAEEPAAVEETVAAAVEEAVASAENTGGDGAGTGEVLSSTSSATDSCLHNPIIRIKIL